MNIQADVEPADALLRVRPRFLADAARQSGGPYGWLTPHVAEIAAENPSVRDRILFLPRSELHFIALVLSLAGAGDANPDAAQLKSFARVLGCERREAILAKFAPNFDPRLARLAGKLAGPPWRAASYRRLAGLADEPHAAKTLAHLRAITRRTVLTLSRLPAPYRTPAVLKLASAPYERAQVLFAIEIVRRVRSDLTDRQILASLEHADARRIYDWAARHYEALPFARAPTEILTDGRDGVLRPICSGRDLRRAAADYDNCVRTYIERAVLGRSVFYRYERAGRRIAIVEVRPVPGLIWAIHEISGPRNGEVEGADRALIIATFAAADVHAAPQAVSRHRRFRLG